MMKMMKVTAFIISLKGVSAIKSPPIFPLFGGASPILLKCAAQVIHTCVETNCPTCDTANTACWTVYQSTDASAGDAFRGYQDCMNGASRFDPSASTDSNHINHYYNCLTSSYFDFPDAVRKCLMNSCPASRVAGINPCDQCMDDCWQKHPFLARPQCFQDCADQAGGDL
jgi:hypothetical protein